ncbi:MAG: ubiquinol-cytochrome c reductase iron-sulfur subunit [Actinomycetota bacterium]
MPIAIAILAILVVAGASVVLLAGRSRSTTGALSRETRSRDLTPSAAASTSAEIESAARTRPTGGGLLRRGRGTVVEYEPVDEEELGVSRRQFLNRGLLTAVGFATAALAPALLAFLWPPKGQVGFGGVFDVGNEDEIKEYLTTTKAPWYAPAARTYVQPFPDDKSALAKAKVVYKPAIYQGMADYGLVAIYQRCVHLGCRVPWCQSSQWFECPCHGSKYNRVGEKTAGPAPRGLDSFRLTVSGSGAVSVDTGTVYIGPPIGTDTTGQQQEGPFCT